MEGDRRAPRRKPAPRAGFAEAQAAFEPPAPVIADACAIIVFYELGGKGMSRRGLDAMAGSVLVSPVTVWELTRKTADGKLPPPRLSDAKNWVDFLVNRGFDIAPLTWEAAAAANALPLHHKDPMDRLLIGTALTLGAPILTNDGVFGAYGVPTIW